MECAKCQSNAEAIEEAMGIEELNDKLREAISFPTGRGTFVVLYAGYL